MYQIIACDLDETLLRPDKSISDKDKAAIQKAIARGVKFVPATGRGYMSVTPTLKELGMYGAAGQYVISFNGGAITENRGNRLLHFQGIPFDLAEEFFRRGLRLGVCIHIYTKETVYVYNLVPEEAEYIRGRMEVTEFFDKDLDFLKGQEIVKCLYMNRDDAYMEKIREDVRDLLDAVDLSYSSNRYIEFNQKGVTKGDGLRRLAAMLGVDMKDTIAIGDNFNDLSMIKAAGLGVGVANTAEAMKAECDHITAATCQESAVSEVIEQFIFGK